MSKRMSFERSVRRVNSLPSNGSSSENWKSSGFANDMNKNLKFTMN
jgi:hypothetical protein